MKLQVTFLSIVIVCVATIAIGQQQPDLSATRTRALQSTCPPPPPDQTAWFDPCVYLLRGNGVKLPRAISLPDPEYSEYARQNKITGNLLLAVAINAGGTVDAVKVVRSLEPSLDQKAVDAVKQWKFMPATKSGKTVAVQMEVEVGFDLH